MRLHSRNRKRKYDDLFNGGDNMSVLSQSIEPGSAYGGPTGSAVKQFRPNGGGGIMGEVDVPYSQYNRSASHSQMGYDKDIVDMHMTLGQRIKVQVDNIPERDIVNPQLLKKYISYARHTVFPKLSMQACGVIKDFYIALRENACNSSNTLPITSRSLDSLIRLSQARAKLELRTIVTRDDAIDVVKLIQESIFEACYTEMGIGQHQVLPS